MNKIEVIRNIAEDQKVGLGADKQAELEMLLDGEKFQEAETLVLQAMDAALENGSLNANDADSYRIQLRDSLVLSKSAA